MDTKQRIISSTRGKVGKDETHRDLTKKQAEELAVDASSVKFANVDVLHDPTELINHVENVMEKHQNEDDDVTEDVDKKTGIITYQMREKNLALNIARSVEAAFKGFSPNVDIHNPKNNEFCNITVTFSPKE